MLYCFATTRHFAKLCSLPQNNIWCATASHTNLMQPVHHFLSRVNIESGNKLFLKFSCTFFNLPSLMFFFAGIYLFMRKVNGLLYCMLIICLATIQAPRLRVYGKQSPSDAVQNQLPCVNAGQRALLCYQECLHGVRLTSYKQR